MEFKDVVVCVSILLFAAYIIYFIIAPFLKVDSKNEPVNPEHDGENPPALVFIQTFDQTFDCLPDQTTRPGKEQQIAFKMWHLAEKVREEEQASKTDSYVRNCRSKLREYEAALGMLGKANSALAAEIPHWATSAELWQEWYNERYAVSETAAQSPRIETFASQDCHTKRFTFN
jgi:hypothetical protein